MDTTVILIVAVVIDVLLSIGLATVNSRRVRALSEVQDVRGSGLTTYQQELMKQLREVGTPRVHLHDVEVISRRLVDRMR